MLNHPFVAISIIIAFAALLVLRRLGCSRSAAFPASALLFVLFVVSAGFVIADYFTGQGIDESVAFHLKYGLSGAGFAEYAILIFFTIILLYFSLCISFLAFFFLNYAAEKKPSVPGCFLGFALLCFSFLINPGTRNLVHLHFSTPKTAQVVGHDSAGAFHAPHADMDEYPVPIQMQDDLDAPDLFMQPSLPHNPSPMNIVHIYLEGLEQTYFDESLFPNLVPQLAQMKRNATSFSDIRQVFGTGWTIAGMVASQCGAPLVTPSGRNSMGGMDAFLPGASCLGGLLNEQGYALTFMGGAPLSFAGKGKFYRTHGFSEVYGLDELVDVLNELRINIQASDQHQARESVAEILLQRLGWTIRNAKEKLEVLFQRTSADNEFVSAWGVYDDALFDLAQKKFHELTAQDRPFGLFLLTLDTHHPQGHETPSCRNRPYADGSNPMLNAVHCADFLVADFVRKIREGDHARNTIIVITSDHLALRNTASELLEQGNRRNLFFILFPDSREAVHVQRPGSLLDVGPTVLSVLGFDVPGLGFGRDLIGDRQTLTEMHDDIDALLRSHGDFLKGLWSFPQLDHGLGVDAGNGRLHFGERSISTPALLVLDEELIVKEVLFDFWDETKLIDHVRRFPPEQPMIWVDSCSMVSAASSSGHSVGEHELCVMISRPGGKHVAVDALHDKHFYPKEQIEQLLRDRSVDSSAYEKRRTRLSNLSRFGVLEATDLPTVTMAEKSISESFVVRSAGGFRDGASYLGSISPVSETTLFFDRGLTLVGITADTVPTKLAHVDTCLGPDLEADTGIVWPSFSDIVARKKSEFGMFVVVAHDSGKCSEELELDGVFQGLPLEKWRIIDHRQPYIGIIPGDGDGYEALGTFESSLIMHIR